jgi:hypothetical protein
MSFDALPRRFSITIDGTPVAMPHTSPDERPQAEAVGRGGNRPAIFEIENEHLVSGPLVMGRSSMEDRSLMPKRVIWCSKDDMYEVQPVRVEMNENGPQIKLRGMRLLLTDMKLI